MPFLDHLEELRHRILRSVAAVGIASLLAYAWSTQILSLLTRGAGSLQTLSPWEGLVTRIKVSLVAGFSLAFPYVLLEAWWFVSPGLYPHERRLLRGLLASSLVCFALGAGFCIWVLGPVVASFMRGFSGPDVLNQWSLAKYVSFVLGLALFCGVVFQVPVVISSLARLGVVSPSTLRRKRRVVIVASFVVGAILTPPDALTQVAVAVPLILLYELGILLAHLTSPRRRRSHG